jgi:hypothetical protein
VKSAVHLTRSALAGGLFSCLLLSTALLLASEEDCPFAAESYRYHPFGWQASDNALVATGRDSGMAELVTAPVCRRVAMEADVLVEGAVEQDDWSVATVAIIRDRANYWHFGLVDPPDSANRPNFCELSEMRDGVWNAQENLKVLRHEAPGGPWRIGQRYRLRITMDPETIEGSIHDSSGELVMRKVFSLEAAAAVTSGRPALRARGLATRFSQINASWDAATAEPPAGPTAPSYQSDSFVPWLTGKATGFFRVERREGKWWAFDPLGRGFVPLGVDHVRYVGHWCEALGYSPYHRKMQQLYPNRDDWVRETAERLSAWGFNRLGGHASPPMIHQGLNYSQFVGIGTPMARLGDEFDITPNEGRPCSAFPNVFHPEFEAYCRYQAETVCRPCVGDPWLFGYFLDNELAWWGRGDHETGLFDAVMKKSAGHTAKIALRDFLARRYDRNVEKLNAAWAMDLESFDEILQRNRLDGSNVETFRADKAAFLALVADRYFACTTETIRAIDPDHLILGCRFAGGRTTADVWAAAAKYCDVLTLNYYGNVDLDRGIALDDDHTCQGDPLGVPFAEFARLACGKPLLVTEWSFIALDSGLPCTNGAGQRFRTQTERARAAGIFAETLLRMPEVIGFDYFMWSDEPAQGISAAFPENSNYGLVNGDNEVYRELVDSLSRVLKRAGGLHREGPQPLPEKLTHGPTVRPPLKLLDRFTGSGSGDPSTLRYEREGSRFVISNGRLTLRGNIGRGPVFHSMRLGDVELGRYVNVAHQLVGRPEWPRTTEVTKAAAIESGARLRVNLANRLPLAAPGSRHRPFEIVQRIHLLPQTDWFLVELVSYRNLAKQPVELGGIYFQIFSALGGDPRHDQPASADLVPRLWGRLPGDAWFDHTAKAFIGVTAPRGAPLKARFWLNEHGGQHPDAHWPVGNTLAPGETLSPDQPVYWIVTAGRGELDTTAEHLKRQYRAAAERFR